MCMFAGRSSVGVSGTNIFARTDGQRQCIAYQMSLRANDDVAMVLPLPVPPGSGESTIQFVDLHGYAGLFADLAELFVVPSFGPRLLSGGPPPQAKLVVHDVGAFEASFVPTLADFARLDERFRMGDEVWRALPLYRDWGFAVFKLKKGDARVHPMAFWFETREPARLFFPTVHVHDGAVHRTARFNHALYWQGEGGLATDVNSTAELRGYQSELSKGIVRDGRVRRRLLRGDLANQDTWIG